MIFKENPSRYAVISTNGRYPDIYYPGIPFQINNALIKNVTYGPKDDHVYIQTEGSPNPEFCLGFGSTGNAKTFVEHVRERSIANQMDFQRLPRYVLPNMKYLEPMILIRLQEGDETQIEELSF